MADQKTEDIELIKKYNDCIKTMESLNEAQSTYWGIIRQLVDKRNNVMVTFDYLDIINRTINVNTNTSEYECCVLCGERKARVNMDSIDVVITDQDDIADIFDILRYGIRYTGSGGPLTITSCKDHGTFEHLKDLVYSGSFKLKDIINLRKNFQ